MATADDQREDSYLVGWQKVLDRKEESCDAGKHCGEEKDAGSTGQ